MRILTELAENGTENAVLSLTLKDTISVSEHSPVVPCEHTKGVIGMADLSGKIISVIKMPSTSHLYSL